MLLLPLTLLAAMGCGSSGGGAAPSPPPNPSIQPGAVFFPVSPRLSPNTAGYTPSQAAAQVIHADRPVLAAAAAGAPIVMDHFFYLVNGVLSNGSNLPTGVGAPTPAVTPLVLTVIGVDSAPNGAPNPNGGTGVGLAALNPDASGSQLWKAVAGPTANYFYLRSAESFTVNQAALNAGFPMPSMLVGFGANTAFLDLGFLSNWNTSIYWNQEGSPTGDNSAFQQWTYNTSTAQLTNLNANGQLYKSSPTAWVAAQSPAPGNQWYTYPNYFLEQVVDEPNSDPPFPAATDSGQTAAYEYISNLPGLNVGGNNCSYEGTSYTGIRCEYHILSTSAALTNCFSAVASANADPPISYNGTTISSSDWTTVASQIENECSYAVGVQNTFNYLDQLLTQIFVSDGDEIAGLATDVGASSSQSLNTVPIVILEGILYTVLNATGSNVAGVVANLMETGVNSALAASSQTLSHPLATTVGNLYTDLGNQFQQVTTGASTAETSILEDWGRLKQAGPATNISGYNGLGLTSAGVADAVTAAIKGYKLAVMQQLMPVVYGLNVSIANLGPPTGLSTSTYNNYTYSTFGYNTENNNSSSFGNSPSLQVMQDDIFDNGANPFEVFNGINGWNAVGYTDANTCNVVAASLFNATPNDLTVKIEPSEGTIAAPGCSGITCEAQYTAELRPYGYATLYAGANGSLIHLDDSVLFASGGTTVATLSFSGSNLCTNSGTISASVSSAGTGYALTSPGTHPTENRINIGNGAGGVWTTIYQ